MTSGEKLISMQLALRVITICLLISCESEQSNSHGLKFSLDDALKSSVQERNRFGQSLFSENVAFGPTISMYRSQRLIVRTTVSIPIPDTETTQFIDMTTLDVDAVGNWSLEHATIFIDTDGQKQVRGRRCRRVGNRLFLSNKYGPWTELNRRRQVGWACLDSSMGSLGQILFKLKHVLSLVKTTGSSSDSFVFTPTLKDDRPDAPIPLPTKMMSSDLIDPKKGGRPLYWATHSVLTGVSGTLIVKPTSRSFPTGEIKFELRFKKNGVEHPMHIEIQHSIVDFKERISRPVDTVKEVKRFRPIRDHNQIIRRLKTVPQTKPTRK